MSDTYLEQVVRLGDDASEMLFKACKATWYLREGQYGEVNADLENFRGDRGWSIAPLLGIPSPEGIVFDQQADGIGTKVKVSQMTSSYEGAAYDMAAMAGDDAVIKGFVPVLMTTVLDVNKFTDQNTPYAEQLATGAIGAAQRARMALYGGETAILGDIVGGYGSPDRNLHFSWSGTVHAIAHKERKIDGKSVLPGMAIVGLRETGLRSNGITMARNSLREAHGRFWHRKSFETETGETTLGRAVLQGSTIYAPVFIDAVGGYDLRVQGRASVEGAAHITGGGVKKLAEMLQASGYGADIEEPYQPPEIMKEVLRASKTPDRVGYETLHMGAGIIAVSSTPEELIECAEDNGVEAKVIGMVTQDPGVVVRSAGITAPGRSLKFAA
jgi:phosphoribosylformylglycinamidine cyclo-ligase